MTGDLIKIELTTDEAVLFRVFQSKHKIVAPIVGFMESLNTNDLSNCTLSFEIDRNGLVGNLNITKHYR